VICAGDPEQAHSWGGWMLETRLGKGTVSAWVTLTRIVDRWREAQAAAATAAQTAAAEGRHAEARAVAERLAELEQHARHGETPGEREVRVQLGRPARDHRADHAAALAVVGAARAAGRAPQIAEVNAAVAQVPALVDGTALNIPAAERSGVTPLPQLPPMQHVGEPPARELTDEEEAAIRETGRRREGQVGLDAEQLLSRRVSRFVREFINRTGRAPTPEESEQISRLVRGQKGATGT